MVFKIAWRLTRDLVARDRGADRVASAGWALIAPLLAGVIAAGAWSTRGGFISDNALGYSEGLATALALIAVDSYMDGSRQRAFVFGFFAALDRPELWFFWGPYGLYLFWRDPGARKLVVGLFALIPVLWFLPELWGSGHLLRGVTRANHPRSNSAAFTKCPVCTVFKKEAWPTVLNRVKIPGIIALFVAAFGLWRTRVARGGGTSGRRWRRVSGHARGCSGSACSASCGGSGSRSRPRPGSRATTATWCSAPRRSRSRAESRWGWFSRIGSPMAPPAWRGSGRACRRLTAPASPVPAGDGRGRSRCSSRCPRGSATNIVSLPRTHHALVYQAHLREDLTAAVDKAGGANALLALRRR